MLFLRLLLLLTVVVVLCTRRRRKSGALLETFYSKGIDCEMYLLLHGISFVRYGLLAEDRRSSRARANRDETGNSYSLYTTTLNCQKHFDMGWVVWDVFLLIPRRWRIILRESLSLCLPRPGRHQTMMMLSPRRHGQSETDAFGKKKKKKGNPRTAHSFPLLVVLLLVASLVSLSCRWKTKRRRPSDSLCLLSAINLEGHHHRKVAVINWYSILLLLFHSLQLLSLVLSATLITDIMIRIQRAVIISSSWYWKVCLWPKTNHLSFHRSLTPSLTWRAF